MAPHKHHPPTFTHPPTIPPNTEAQTTPNQRTMRAFLLVALLALIALAQAFVPRAALPKKAAVVVKAKMAPFAR